MVFRLSIAYVSNPMSGAFGGLLATGLNTLAGVNGNSGWRFIFWIEGAMTVVVGVVAYFLLFNDLETAPFFTEEERAFALAQMAADKPPNSQEHDQFSWTRVIQGE